jgi:hypothetical protein
MDCSEVDPVNEDNFLAACMSQCRDDNTYAEDLNEEDAECHQAFRKIYTCIASEATCEDIATEFEGVCVGQYFDVVEFCENSPFPP